MVPSTAPKSRPSPLRIAAKAALMPPASFAAASAVVKADGVRPSSLKSSSAKLPSPWAAASAAPGLRPSLRKVEVQLALARGHRPAGHQRQLLCEVHRHAQLAGELAAFVRSRRGNVELRITAVGILADHRDMDLARLGLDPQRGALRGEVAVHLEGRGREPQLAGEAEGQRRGKARLEPGRRAGPVEEGAGQQVAQAQRPGVEAPVEHQARASGSPSPLKGAVPRRPLMPETFHLPSPQASAASPTSTPLGVVRDRHAGCAEQRRRVGGAQRRACH